MTATAKEKEREIFRDPSYWKGSCEVIKVSARMINREPEARQKITALAIDGNGKTAGGEHHAIRNNSWCLAEKHSEGYETHGVCRSEYLRGE